MGITKMASVGEANLHLLYIVAMVYGRKALRGLNVDGEVPTVDCGDGKDCLFATMLAWCISYVILLADNLADF